MATIDLGLVKGADGAAGATGPQGPAGATGATGPQGPAGRGLPTGETEGQMPIRGASDIEWQDPLVIKNQIGALSISDGTDIDTGESMDNLRTVGTYACETDTIAASLVNAPTAKAFVLAVSYATGTNAIILQTLIEAESGRRFIRAYTAGTGTWGAWALDLSVPAAAPVLPVANGGTGQTSAAAFRSALGLGNTLSALPVANGGTGATSASAARTALQAAAATHSHAASDITIGTLSAARGGTGNTSLQATRNAMGLGNTTGALPVANGGTGQTTLQAARNAMGLGNTTGALPVANGGTGAATAAAALAALGGISIATAWTNASPTSTFAEQNITLNGSYDMVIVFCRWSTSQTTAGGSGIGYVGQTSICHAEVANSAARQFQLTSATNVHFYPAVLATVENNTYCIPVKIFGIKGVS